jgi:acyl-CoA dehydrogenase
MNDDIALVEASLERLLAMGEDRDATWARLKSSGMTEALLAPEHAFATAGAIVKVAARHDASFPLLEALLVTWLADHAGLDLQARLPAFAVASFPATVELVGADDGMRIDGTLDAVGDAAEGLLCVLPCAGQPWLAYLDKVTPGEAGCNLAGEHRQALEFDNVAIGPGFAAPLDMDETRPLLGAAFLRSAQMLGAMERCLSLATRYAAERQQFGRPIMQFQAVQHLCAEIAAGVAAARAAVAHAAAALDRGSGILETAIAKSLIGEMAGSVAAAAHQIHGAIGFTNEYPLGIATRRLWSWRDEYGDEAFWNGVVGTAAIAWQDKTWSNLVDGSPQREEDLKRALAMTEFRP